MFPLEVRIPSAAFTVPGSIQQHENHLLAHVGPENSKSSSKYCHHCLELRMRLVNVYQILLNLAVTHASSPERMISNKKNRIKEPK